MKCRIARQLISSFLDGTLDEGRERLFVSHVQRCGGCRQLLEEARLACEALQDFVAEDMDVPEDLSARIKGAIRQAEEDTRLIETSSAPAIGSPAFIATCASLFIGAVMFYVVTTEVYMERLDAQERSTSLAADMTRLTPESQAQLAHATASPTASDPGLALLAASSEADEGGSAPEVNASPEAVAGMLQSLTVSAPGADLSALGTTTSSPTTVRRRHTRPTSPAGATRPAASAASVAEESVADAASGPDAADAPESEETEVRETSIVDAKVLTPAPQDAGEREPEEASLSFFGDIPETTTESPLAAGSMSYFVSRPGWEAEPGSYVPAHAAVPGELPSRRDPAPH